MPPVAVGEPEDTQPIIPKVVAPSIQIEIEDEIISQRVDPCIQIEIEDDILDDLIQFDRSSDFKHQRFDIFDLFKTRKPEPYL